MRKWLHQNTTLIQSTVNIQDFPGVNSGQTIVFIKNTPPKKKDCVLLIDQTSQDSRRINLSTLKSKYTFYLKKQPAWVYNLENFSKLSQISRINTGINIGGSSKEFVSNQRSGNNFYPIVTVAQMKEKYFLDTNIPFDFVDFNQKKVEELNKINSLKPRRNIIVLGRLERFLSPKLFIRQSAPEIIAGYSDQVIVCPYSIFVLNPFVNISLLSILAILNSRLITEYSRETGIIRTGAGKQPQIRKKGLDNIPVPPLETFEKTRDILENAVKILLSTDRIKFPGQIMEYKKEIEKIVASMYQMNPKDY
jgi:hypothetical protein